MLLSIGVFGSQIDNNYRHFVNGGAKCSFEPIFYDTIERIKELLESGEMSLLLIDNDTEVSKILGDEIEILGFESMSIIISSKQKGVLSQIKSIIGAK